MERMVRYAYELALVLATTVGIPLFAQSAGHAEARQIYLVPFSHLDYFWGGTREECLARGNRIIARAIELEQRYPDFRFLLEDDDFVANFMESHRSLPEADEFKRLVRQGRIEIAPKWAAIFQDLQDGEVLARNLIYGLRYARSVFGVEPKTAHLGDIPGFTPQYPQILKEAGIPYMVMTRMGPSDHSLFFWKAPDGSRVLTWFTLKGYGWGAHLGLHEPLDENRRSLVEKELAQVESTTTAPIFMNWGSDLFAPNAQVAENLNVLNREIPNAHFRFATPDQYFNDVCHLPGIPELSGEIPSSWPNIVSSLPHLWPLIIPATNTLLAAERFATINYALKYSDYPQQQLEYLWRKLIESTDHNHDGQGGWAGDERKRSYSELAIVDGGEILRDMLRNIAERVQIPIRPSTALIVFNPLAWTRDDLIEAHITVYGDVVPGRIQDYRRGVRLLDESGKDIPFHIEQYSENMSRAFDIAFVAKDVPSVGYKAFYFVPAAATPDFGHTAQIILDKENDLKEPRRPLGVDTIENDFYRISLDRATGNVTVFDKQLQRDLFRNMEIIGTEERGGNYIGIEPLSGRIFPASVNDIRVEENNGVRAIVTLNEQVIDIPITQHLILYKALKRLDIENTIEWRAPRLVRVEQLFPYGARQRHIQYGVPFGSNAADNLMAGTGPHQHDEISKESWLQSRHIQNWIFVGDQQSGATISTNAAFVKLSDGVIRGEMLRGARFTSVKVVRGDAITSMDYPPPGRYTFKYSITSGPGDWKANRSYRSGMNFNNPLLPVSVVDDISPKPLPPSQSFFSINADNVILSALKKADDNSRIVARFYEIEGSPAAVPLSFLGHFPSWQGMNLLEQVQENKVLSAAIPVKPFEIKTISFPAR